MRSLALLRLALIVALGVAVSASAANSAKNSRDPEFPPFTRLMSSEGSTPAFVLFDQGAQPKVDAFIANFLAAVPVDAGFTFKLLGSTSDPLGEQHYRLQELYRGLPVLGAEYIVHERNGLVRSANGTLVDGMNLDPQPALSESDALARALDRVGARTYMWQDPYWVKEIKQRTGNPDATYFPSGVLCWSPNAFGMPGRPARYTLAYSFDINAASPNQAVRVIVDARSGAIITTLPLEANCSSASVNTVFNGSQTIFTDKFTGTDYRLRDNCQSAALQVRDWHSTTTTAAPVEIQNTTNTWTTMNERFGGTVLWETKQAYLYYLNTYGRASYDNSNGSVDGYVNAVFDCSPPAGCTYTDNASMSFTGGRLKVGLGSSGTLANSWCPLDVISHEFTHAVTGSSANLTYANESGALNESFSDIMGEAVEFTVLGGPDWLEGAARSSGAIRSFSNPKTFSNPDTYLGTYWYTGTGDAGGVHTNSGVQNHWYYLLSQGGSGTNDNGWSYSFTGIGIVKAAAISYRNLTVYLTSGSVYTDARNGSIQAAADLYGAGSVEQQTVIKAWRAVGIDPCQITCPANVVKSNDPAQCGATVSYTAPTDNGMCFTVTKSPASGTFFAVGTTSVTATSTSGASCSFDVTVNDTEQPSVSCPAAATVECTTHSGTPASDPAVQAFLNGFTATDNCPPAPTKSNTAPLVFPHGSTTVTFTATDAHTNSNSCSATLKVVDTTPPVLSCASDLTLECDSHCDASLGGVPATDAAVAAWLASFTAADACDPSPTTSLPYPACFKLGDTQVTFTATDDDGNTASCTRTVHVVDTTPPTIVTSLSRDVLWPPNHKMITIDDAVTIADICDPSPFFQLISIVSNEPDNGLGDGDTPNDIQGASYGTADTEFQLRSERSGTGTGRTYTITYRAFDHAGNHADAVDVVRVTHDQSASATASNGMNDDGTGFDPNADTFAVLLRSVPLSVLEGGGGTSEVSTSGIGTPTTGDGSLLFNTRLVDDTDVLVGNGAGALRPIRTVRLDADKDGYTDLVCLYRVADAKALMAASALDDGPVGIHYSVRSGADYLVPSLFGLGAPLRLANLNAPPGAPTSSATQPGASQVSSKPAASAATAGATTTAAAPKPVAALPAVTELAGAYPVPMTREAHVMFTLASESSVELSIYDVRGAKVRTLHAGTMPAGRYSLPWDGRSDSGAQIHGGVYFIHMSAGSYRGSRKVIVMP